MRISFSKYQGTGNDFVMIDNREQMFPKEKSVIRRLSDRKFGIGADGVILLENHSSADFLMIYYNPDGSKSLCGNGSRCAVAFAAGLGIIQKSAYFETTDGFHHARVTDEIIDFELLDVERIETISEEEYFVNTGSPHHICLVHDITAAPVLERGAEIRFSPGYEPYGTNVNFVALEPGSISVRTYERGVENETLSCGTGVTAVGLTASLLGYSSPVSINTPGGKLSISFRKENDRFTDIYLSGPAKKVFEGEIEI